MINVLPTAPRLPTKQGRQGASRQRCQGGRDRRRRRRFRLPPRTSTRPGWGPRTKTTKSIASAATTTTHNNSNKNQKARQGPTSARRARTHTHVHRLHTHLRLTDALLECRGRRLQPGGRGRLGRGRVRRAVAHRKLSRLPALSSRQQVRVQIHQYIIHHYISTSTR